jgi:hypothetical protein
MKFLAMHVKYIQTTTPTRSTTIRTVCVYIYVPFLASISLVKPHLNQVEYS